MKDREVLNQSDATAPDFPPELDVADRAATPEDDARIEAALGTPKKLTLSSIGRRPYRCPAIVSAWWSLRSTHASVARLFDTVYLVRCDHAQDKAPRRLHQDALDLLRAAIVFTSAGVDACLTVLLKDALPILAVTDQAASVAFKRYISGQLDLNRTSASFREALLDKNPRDRMLDLFIAHLATPSFQRSSEIQSRVRDALGLDSQEIAPERITALDAFFTARNQVVHEMDQLAPKRIDAAPVRRVRNQAAVRDMCDEALLLLRDIIRATAAKLKCLRANPGEDSHSASIAVWVHG